MSALDSIFKRQTLPPLGNFSETACFIKSISSPSAKAAFRLSDVFLYLSTSFIALWGISTLITGTFFLSLYLKLGGTLLLLFGVLVCWVFFCANNNWGLANNNREKRIRCEKKTFSWWKMVYLWKSWFVRFFNIIYNNAKLAIILHIAKFYYFTKLLLYQFLPSVALTI